MAMTSRYINLSVYIEQNSSGMSFHHSGSWTILSDIERRIRAKIETVGTPLCDWNISINYGIKTGCNEAFIISTQKKDELITADPKSAEIIRPILRGRDIKRYGYMFADLWLINVHNGIKHESLPPVNIEDYPAIKRHLDQYYSKLAKRADKGDTPYNLRNCVYMNDFSKPKIVYREISTAMDACMVGPGIVLNNKCYLITGDHLPYLLAYFNSKLFTKIILPQANATGGKGEGFLSNICAKLPSKSEEAHIEHLVDLMGSVGENEAANTIDAEIDSMLAEIYGLTEDEKSYLARMIV